MNLLKPIILLCMIIVAFFLGVTIFRYFNITKVGLNDKKEVQITRDLSGQVLKGDKIESLPVDCSNQYFLKTDKTITWLIPDKKDYKGWSTNILRYDGLQAEVIGHKDFGYSPCKYGKAADCGCNSYTIVDSINIIEE